MRFVIGAEDERAPEKISAEVLSCRVDCKALAFKRRIILLGRRQFLLEEGDWAFDVFFRSFEEYGADSNFGCVGVNDKLF